MVRAMYSGVSGMKSQQIKMDTIGNNIANVGTYGYKSSRTTFRDVFYQTNKAPSAPTGATGGTNPMQVGVGTKVASIDVNHSQSVMTTTGFSLDVAIAGEGYLQVQDVKGNIYYTKAGMLDIDSAGNLVDSNGNFVLGVSGDPAAQEAGSNRIRISLPNELTSEASVTELIHGRNVTISSSTQTDLANVTVAFETVNNLPLNTRAAAQVTSDNITIQLNQDESFASWEDFEDAINNAITTAYGGDYTTGDLRINIDDPNITFPLTAENIVSSDYSYQQGTIALPDEWTNRGFKVIKSGVNFGASPVNSGANAFALPNADGIPNSPLQAEGQLSVTEVIQSTGLAPAVAGDGDAYQITIGDYSAILTKDSMRNGNSVTLKRDPNLDDTDSITVEFPKLEIIENSLAALNTAGAVDTLLTQSVPSKSLGFESVPFALSGGTAGGPQTIADLTSIAVSDTGVLSAIHDIMGYLELGRIDLATFANPKGMEQVGDTYFEATTNSGNPKVVRAGSQAVGSIASATLETSNVDLANEFSDMIVTQRGFQASSRIITVSDSMIEELVNLKR